MRGVQTAEAELEELRKLMDICHVEKDTWIESGTSLRARLIWLLRRAGMWPVKDGILVDPEKVLPRKRQD